MSLLQHLLQEPVGIFLIMIAVILLAPLFSQLLRLPGIVGLILGGVVIGPNGLGLLAREGAIELLGTVGLVYLMFSAGAEIDLAQFNQTRNRSMVFGFLTFIIPQTSGIFLGLALGYSLMSAVLLGSLFASHTLVSFPIITRLGVSRNTAISVTVGATIFTDIAALLVLAAVAGVSNGDVTVFFFARLLILLLGYTALILLGVPRLGRFFFKHFSGRSLEFQFVLVVIFVAAFLAELIGMEAIVGAFLAGLAINSTISHHSPVMGRVLFIGESFFVPIFLLSIGLLIDPLAFFRDSRTIVVSIALSGTVLATKFAASWLTARFFGYGFPETMVMWGLSMAQAAATLAAVLVGIQVGLFDTAIFNGIITMILVTCVISPLLVERFGPRLVRIEAAKVAAATNGSQQRPLFERVLIPVANPHTETHLINLADILARSSKGVLMPLNIARLVNGQAQGLDQQERLLNAEILNNPETTVLPIRRVDSSISHGILGAAIENDASTIIMGWSGQSSFAETIFGRMLDEVIWQAKLPVLVGRITSAINAKQRVLLVIPPQSISQYQINDVLDTANGIATAVQVPLIILTDELYIHGIEAHCQEAAFRYQMHLLDRNIAGQITSMSGADDLIVVTTVGSQQRFRSSLGNIPEEIAAQTPASMIVIHYPFDE